MNIFIRAVLGLLLIFIITTPVIAAPWEVLGDVTYMRKGGVNAVRIDFALPVHYISHFPVKHGKTLTINLRFDKQEVKDTSELPLLQTLNAPESLLVPLKDVTYMTDSGEPKLVVNFKKDVNFNVSQVMGINSLVIFLPEAAQPEVVDPQLRPVEKEIKAVDETKSTAVDEKAKRILDEGRAALRNGDNKKAIQIFTKLLSMPKHAYMQPSLELLGLARERNNQAAQAKVVYDDYLKKYPKGDGAIRVRQRIADLIAARMTPRRRLKETETRKLEKQATKTYLSGNFGQYFDYSAMRFNGESTQPVSAQLENQASLQYRIRSGSYDIRNRFDGSYTYDALNSQSVKGMDVSYMYSRLRNTKLGIDATIGRQRQTAGVFGRFDGASFNYALAEKVQLNLLAGYPVSYLHRQQIQTDQPFAGMGFELSDIWKGWDISPYYMKQNSDGILNREAVGTEVRYAHQTVNFWAVVDYDIYFKELNMFQFNGQYNVFKSTALTLSGAYRKTPLLETNNALQSLPDENAKLSDIVTCFSITSSPCDLRQLANDRTGVSSYVSGSVSHEFSPKYTFITELDYSKFLSKTVNPATVTSNQDYFDTASTSSTDAEVDLSLRLVASELYDKRDFGITYFMFSHANTFDSVYGAFSYRRPILKNWRANAQLSVRRRKSNTGEILLKTIPDLKLQYHIKDKWQIYTEASVEFWKYSGTTTNPGNTTANFFLGYNYFF